MMRGCRPWAKHCGQPLGRCRPRRLERPLRQSAGTTSGGGAWQTVPVGVAAGLFGSMVGVGGGVIMTPFLVGPGIGLVAKQAVATSLVAVLGTGATAAAVFAYEGCVDWVGAAALSAAAMLTAAAGARFAQRVPDRQLKMIYGAFLMAVAPTVPFKDTLFPGSAHATPSEAAAAPAAAPGYFSMTTPEARNQYLGILALTGSLAGFLSGLLGIGGGTIVTPLLALASGMPQQAVLGTSMLAMVAPSATALRQHHLLGNVQWRTGRALLVGSAAGGIAGSALAVHADEALLKRLFGAGIFFLGAKTFTNAVRA